MATIDLADDGPGLPDAVRATLFRPFARSTRHDGAGLGLAIARDLMLAHGGEIALASSGPEGTVFRLTLRIAQPGDANDRDAQDRDARDRDTADRDVPAGEVTDRVTNDRTAAARGIAPAARADV